jgi:hypothetical protein
MPPLLLCLLWAGCASQGPELVPKEPDPPPPPSPEEVAAAKAARIEVSKIEPEGCRKLGEVTGQHFSFIGLTKYEKAMEDLRDKADDLKANYVVLDGINQASGNLLRLLGRAYACPDKKAAVAPAPKTEAACEPACSPGYTCLRGTCVSACNPACPSDQRCGPDRTCHRAAD